MSELSIPAMLDQVQPGRILRFDASPGKSPADQRHLAVAQTTRRYGAALHTSMTWIDPPDIQHLPRVGGIERARRPLAAFTDIRLKFTGPPRALFDYYSYTSDIVFITERLKDLIESFDPDALESVRVTVDTDAELNTAFFAVMPRRQLWAVDPAVTNVTVEHAEFLPGRFIKRLEYDGDIYLSADIPPDVHVFKDYGYVYWFWSVDLLDAAKAAGISGISANRLAGGVPRSMEL